MCGTVSKDEAVNVTAPAHVYHLKLHAMENSTSLPPQYDYAYVVEYRIEFIILSLGIAALLLSIPLLVALIKFIGALSPTYMIIVNILICNVGMEVVETPLSVGAIMGTTWLQHPIICQIYAFSDFIFLCASFAYLAMFAIDRYIIYCSRDHGGKINHYLYSYVMIAVWIMAALWAWLPPLGWGEYVPEPANFTCSINWQQPADVTYVSFLSVYSLLNIALPLIIATFCVGACIRKRFWRLSYPAPELFHSGRDEALMKVCMTLIETHLLSWLPYFAIWFGVVFSGDPRTVHPTLALTAGIATRFCHILDPLVCVIADAQVRNVVRKMFTCGKLVAKRPERKIKHITLEEVKMSLNLQPAEMHPSVLL
ncbi:PREDICTED: visual pigment-like receptor peropsin [Priapulus caudatus]|uniref:Visual pigment-like receptor peropsin n=1 Tax=Priapulus caudatus TaxID=37621 RepID=A0ABM1DTV2_PRICU|nr:PREDICTED: visual pigment-like receptor peropsin [Priapulus caudatus]